jgi:hypothetical protein
MRIGVIGVGSVGTTLGKKLAAVGHEVVMGTRDPDGERAAKAKASLPADVAIRTMPEACRSAEVVVLAIPGSAMDETIAALAGDLAGKVVVDAANRIGASLGDTAVMNSLAAFERQTPTTAVFRAFNSLGWENFAEPEIGGVQADLLYCGPDGPPRETVEELIAAVGLRPVYVGGPEKVALVDAVGALWGALAFGRGMGRRLFFKVVTP